MDPTTQRLVFGATTPPVEITFTANNYYPAADTTVVLTWNVLYSASVSIDQGIGTVAATANTSQSGNNVTRIYTLTSVGLDSVTATQSLTITWQAPAHPCPAGYYRWPSLGIC